jgi:hypothetical protein
VVEADLGEPSEPGARIEDELAVEGVEWKVDALLQLRVEVVEARVAVQVGSTECVPLECEGIGVLIGLHEPRDEAHDRETVPVPATDQLSVFDFALGPP